MNVFIAHIENNKAVLSPEESWHCAKVLRMRAGENVKLIDGAGNFYEAALEEINEKSCIAKILAPPVRQASRNYFLHLAIAPTKQIDRIEWMIEKCVEIGINEISLLTCKNSERKNVNPERLQKIVLSAVKQSMQAFVPVLRDIAHFEKFVSSASEEQKLIAHCGSGQKAEISSVNFKNKKTLILIGPEGDFTSGEIETALSFGYTALSLGNNRLRTETAGLYVCQAASILSL